MDTFIWIAQTVGIGSAVAAGGVFFALLFMYARESVKPYDYIGYKAAVYGSRLVFLIVALGVLGFIVRSAL